MENREISGEALTSGVISVEIAFTARETPSIFPFSVNACMQVFMWSDDTYPKVWELSVSEYRETWQWSTILRVKSA